MKKLLTILAISTLAHWHISILVLAQQWKPVGTGMNNRVEGLGSFNSELFAGGQFTIAGGIPANNAARWNGLSWDSAGPGFDATVNDFTEFNNSLYACGGFFFTNGISVDNIARWNGLSWDSVGQGLGIRDPYCCCKITSHI